ncbi:MAG TPA: S1/P1 nuclease, partial [Bacteroidia bacterium]
MAEIAKLYLDKGVEEQVQKYLGSTTFEEAAVWMDEIKKDHSYDNMKPWHYINIDKDKTYVKAEEGNVVIELEKSIALLNNKKALKEDEINTNVKILFHLVGDLHMPL